MQFALGFLAAFAVLFLAFALRVRRWRARRRFGMAGPGFAPGRRWPFRALFARLDTSPSQERVLVEEAAALREELGALRADWQAVREELASLLDAPTLDVARVEAVLSARDARLAALRRRAADALARFHGVLDDAQRRALAAVVKEGPAFAHAHGRGRC
jgi:hypothetical protein